MRDCGDGSRAGGRRMGFSGDRLGIVARARRAWRPASAIGGLCQRRGDAAPGAPPGITSARPHPIARPDHAGPGSCDAAAHAVGAGAARINGAGPLGAKASRRLETVWASGGRCVVVGLARLAGRSMRDRRAPCRQHRRARRRVALHVGEIVCGAAMLQGFDVSFGMSAEPPVPRDILFAVGAT